MTASPSHSKPGWSRWVGLAGAAAVLFALPVLAQQTPKPPPPKRTMAEKPPAETALAAAQQAIDRQDYATAVTILENFLFEHPGQAEALFNLAYCYSLQGRMADAMEMYRQTLEVDPKLFAAHLNLGLLLLNDGQPAPAAEELQRAAELDPNHYRAQLYAAVALERSGQADKALEHYRRAAALDSQQEEPRRAILALLVEKDDIAGAEAVLEELRALAPGDPSLARLQGDLRLRQGKREEALAAYEEYLQAQPGDPAVHLQVGRLYRELGKPEEALRHFTAAEPNSAAPGSSDPSGRLSLVERADTLAALKRWNEAIPLYHEALTGDPANAELHAALGYALLQNRNFPEAVVELTEALQRDPSRVETYNHLASALYLSGNLAGVIEVLDRRATHAEETPATLFLRAISYDKLKQCGPAITYYKKFLALNRDTASDQYFQATGRLRLLKSSCRDYRPAVK